MKKLTLTSVILSCLLLSVNGAAQGFKVYPGATKLEKESAEATKNLPNGGESSVYVTKDSYEKVVAFYQGIGQE